MLLLSTATYTVETSGDNHLTSGVVSAFSINRHYSSSSSPLFQDYQQYNYNSRQYNHFQIMELRYRGKGKGSRVGSTKEASDDPTATTTSTNGVEMSSKELLEENEKLRMKIKMLQKVNKEFEKEQQHSTQKIVIETFEGEDKVGEKWCENDEQKLDDGSCPIEPDVSFRDALRDRALWLVGLLVMQSCSSFFLARNEELLTSYPTIVYFLTMLVGAGGNAGNQASVRVIRGLALGAVNDKTQQQFITREFRMAIALSSILSIAGFLRAIFFKTPFPETIAVTAALFMIVFISVCFGAILPLLLKKIGVDPAHSSTSIQVIMDILGVIITVAMSTFFLESPFGKVLITKLIG